MFSTILDISSFFMGMLINLLLIALICYYFKRKYETLEASQNEQAKILYNLIQSQTPKSTFNINELITNAKLNSTMMTNPEDLEDLTSDTESETDSEDESVCENNEPVKILNLNDTAFTIESLDKNYELNEESSTPILVTKVDDVLEMVETLQEEDSTSKLIVEEQTDYSKLSMKQLKDILSKKGINSNHRMKKNDLISLIEHGVIDSSSDSNTLNLKDEMEEVNI
jgi:hypothetical protein